MFGRNAMHRAKASGAHVGIARPFHARHWHGGLWRFERSQDGRCAGQGFYRCPRRSGKYGPTDAGRREAIGHSSGAVQVGKVKRMQTYGGEAMLRVGAAIVVSAPVGGTLQPPPGGPPQVGAAVHRDQPMFLLLPLLSPERGVLTPAERIRFAEAKNAFMQQRIDCRGASAAGPRTDRCRRDRLRSRRAIAARRAGNDANRGRSQGTARAWRKSNWLPRNRASRSVEKIRLDEDPGDAGARWSMSAQNGIVRSQQATVGEVVSAGAPLFEVMDCDQLWIRVRCLFRRTRRSSIPPRPRKSRPSPERTRRPSSWPGRLSPRPRRMRWLRPSICITSCDNTGRRVSPRRACHRRTADGRGSREPRDSLVGGGARHHGGSWVYEKPSRTNLRAAARRVRYVVDAWAVLGQGQPPEPRW